MQELEQSKAIEEIQAQQAHLHKLESEWKLKEAKTLSEIKQREVEMQQQLEKERAKLHPDAASFQPHQAAPESQKLSCWTGAQSCRRFLLSRFRECIQ